MHLWCKWTNVPNTVESLKSDKISLLGKVKDFTKYINCELDLTDTNKVKKLLNHILNHTGKKSYSLSVEE